MLKLTNIQLNTPTIKADYIPENSQKSAHVSLNVDTDKGTYDVLDEYGAEYGIMAVSGLRRIMLEKKNGGISELPKEKTVMWY